MKDRRLNPGYFGIYPSQRFITHISGPGLRTPAERNSTVIPDSSSSSAYYDNICIRADANKLGNIREVPARDIERDNYYASGRLLRRPCVEKVTKSICAVPKGVGILQYVTLTDAFQRKFEDGAHDVAPVSGLTYIEPSIIKLLKY